MKKHFNLFGIIASFVLLVFSVSAASYFLYFQNLDPRNKASTAANPYAAFPNYRKYDAVEQFGFPDNNLLSVKKMDIASIADECGQNPQSYWQIAVNGATPEERKFNLCQNSPDTQAVVPECAGADFIKGNLVYKDCYWSKEKKLVQRLNTRNLPYGGCYRHGTPENRATPGGYLNTMATGTFKNVNFDDPLNTEYYLQELDKLEVTLTAEVTKYNTFRCPESPADPLLPYVPHMQFNIAVLVTDIDPETGAGKGTYIYQVTMWSSDTGYLESARPFVNLNCTLPAIGITFASGDASVKSYGLEPLKPGQGAKTYTFDILPGIQNLIAQCKKDYNRNNAPTFKISSVFITQEGANTADLESVVTKPQFKFYKKGLPTGAITNGYTHTNCFKITGWAYDPKKAPNDNLWLHVYTKNASGQLEFIGSAFANMPSEPGKAVGDSGNHGFEFTIPTKYRDNKPHEFYFYALNNQLNQINPLIGGKPVTVQCNYLIGSVDTTQTCNRITGYVYNSNVPKGPNAIHIYYIDPKTKKLTYLTGVNTFLPRPNFPLVIDSAAGINQGFEFSVPTSLRDGIEKEIHFYAIDSTGNKNIELVNSPVKIKCV